MHMCVCMCTCMCVECVCVCVVVVCVVVFNETVAVGENRKNEEGFQAGDMMSFSVQKCFMSRAEQVQLCTCNLIKECQMGDRT